MSQALCFGCSRGLETDDHFRHLTRACEQCFNAIMFARGTDLSRYLESLAFPAAVLAKDHTVLSANGHFRALRLDQRIVGARIGEALDCGYAPLLGQCGEAPTCILCSLRRTVEHTWATGEGLRDVEMTYPHRRAGRKKVEVTTEKVGDAILVIVTEPTQSSQDSGSLQQAR